MQAFELHDYQAAIHTLEKLVTITGINETLLSNSKILLADIYLSTGDRWEATLLYSQVDKQHKEDETGQLARFRNAKLSYYMGDFDWAQKQFDILRSATSRLIANDAIDMNIFIIDNLGLDTTEQNLKAYALILETPEIKEFTWVIAALFKPTSRAYSHSIHIAPGLGLAGLKGYQQLRCFFSPAPPNR